VNRLLLIVVALGGLPALAQNDIHNGPVAIRPMVTAPHLVGKTPTIPKFSHCPAERAQLREAWRAFDAQMVNGYDADLNLTRAQLKQRYLYGDKIIATLGASIKAVGMDCEDALSLATDTLGGG
jgi:hypothetical protein